MGQGGSLGGIVPGGVVHKGAEWAGGTQRFSLSVAMLAAPERHTHTHTHTHHATWDLHLVWLCSSPMTSGGDTEPLKKGYGGRGAPKGTHLNSSAPLLHLGTKSMRLVLVSIFGT